MAATVSPRAPVTFFVSTFALAWTLWIVAATLSSDVSAGLGVRALFFIPGVFAPGIVALWLTARAGGRPATDRLLNRIFDGAVGTRWFLFAACFPVTIKLLAAALHRAMTGGWPAFGQEPWFVLVGATLFSTPFQAGEELGWRGYALPRLASRMGYSGAGVLLGAIWACWHLPLFLIPGTDTTGQSFPLYLFQVTAISVAMTWLYATQGSLLPVMLLHAAINNTGEIVPSEVAGASDWLALSPSLVGWLTCAWLWVAATYFLIRMPPAPIPNHLHPGHEV